ncbi:hypothetical protein Gotur_025289 [Gossypium turneri]
MLYAAVFFLGSAAIAGILHVTALKIFDRSLLGLKYDPALIWGYFEVCSPAPHCCENKPILELHIEQGPVLELVGFPLTVVKGTATQTGMKMMKQRHKVEREANIMPKLDGRRIRKLPRLIQSL